MQYKEAWLVVDLRDGVIPPSITCSLEKFLQSKSFRTVVLVSDSSDNEHAMEFRLGKQSRSMADYGRCRKKFCKRIEQLLDQMGIECEVIVDGGSGHGDDITWT